MVSDPKDPPQLIPEFALPKDVPMYLKGIPMPPSHNALYGTNWRTKRRFLSKAGEEWKAAVTRWAFINASDITQARAQVKQAIEKKEIIHVAAQFWFRKSKVLTLNGVPKKIDTSNRLKALHDVLGELLEVDDCHFWNGSFEKIPTTTVDHDWVDVRLTLEPRPVAC